MAQPRFIRFEANGAHNGKPRYIIVNKRSGEWLGQVFWYPTWRQWACSLMQEAIWSEDCLEDIRAFILGLGKDEGRG